MAETNIDDEINIVFERMNAGGSASDAIERLNDLYIDGERRSLYWYVLGVAWGRVDNLKKAIRCLKNAISVDTSNADAHCELAVAYAEILETELARKSAQRALDIRASDPYIWRTCGKIFVDLQDYEQGIRLLRAAHTALPDDEGAVRALVSGLLALTSSLFMGVRWFGNEAHVEMVREANNLLTDFELKYPRSIHIDEMLNYRDDTEKILRLIR